MKKILICDDEIDIREVLEMLIGVEFDIEVYHADNGIEGIELLGKGINFDLIICDMNMPKAKGVDVYNHNKKNDDYPFILLSAECESDVQHFSGFVECSKSDTLKKPWKENELFDKIKYLLAA